jgi:hypothetical protein
MKLLFVLALCFVSVLGSGAALSYEEASDALAKGDIALIRHVRSASLLDHT